MSPENAHKLIRIYMGGLILGVNTLYMLSCFLKQFALVGNGLNGVKNWCVGCEHLHSGSLAMRTVTQSWQDPPPPLLLWCLSSCVPLFVWSMWFSARIPLHGRLSLA